MDCRADDERTVNPQENASWLSLITFFYTRGIFKKSFTKTLEEEDIYKVLGKHKSKLLGDKLEKEWKIEVKNHEHPSIYRLLWRCYGRKYLFIGFVQLMMRSIMIIYSPLAIGKLISYFTPDQKDLSKRQAYYYAALVIGLNLLNCVYLHNYMLIITEFGIRIRTAFCSLMYRKCLTLRNSSLSHITTGKIVTLMTKDVSAFEMIVLYGNDVWIGFVQAAIVCYLIYCKIGAAAFAGIGFFLLILPIQIYIGKKATALRMQTGKMTDERLQVMQESLSAIKIIKIYAWEQFFSKKISDARKREVNNIVKIFYTKTIILLMGALTSKLAFYFLIMTYIWLGNLINAELIYYILTCFARLRHALSVLIPMGITEAAELSASVERIGNLLKIKETDSYKSQQAIITPKIKIDNVTVATVLKNISLRIDPGLTALTGPVGSGKTTLLKLILDDFSIKEGTMACEGIISYASQDPWIFPSTIRQNIVFGEDFDEKRYDEILEVCGLKSDIESFEKRDATVVGDKGINLSKGQQCRINLARAVYKKSDIYLFDDCLSSLDANVRDFVFKECFKRYLKDKLCILVTHDIKFIKKCENVIVMLDGEIQSHTKSININEEDLKFVIKNENTIFMDVKKEIECESDLPTNEETKLLNSTNNNIYHETKKSGKVAKSTYLKYIQSGGGFLMLGVVFLFFVMTQASKSYTEKMVSTWVNLEENISNHKLKNLTETENYAKLMQSHFTILIEFSVVIIATSTLSILTACLLFNFTRKASNRLHDGMVSNVIQATMEFFDDTFIGNILNRCSKDLATVDELLPFVLYEFIEIILAIIGIVVLIASVNLTFLIPTGIFLLILYFIRMIYLPTGRNLHRLDAATRSPVIGYLNASMDGLTTIKAYGAEKLLTEEFDSHQDLYTSTNYMSKCTGRAFGFLLDMLCIIYISAIVGRFLIIDSDTSVGDIGMAITQSFGLTGLVQYGIRQWADLENKMTSVERVLEYTDIKKENRQGLNPQKWPTEGRILFKNVSLVYRKKKQILNNINFEIKPREKVGIVGRTGAGKTSLISSLMRLYNIDGNIEIDGIDTKQLSLDVLRKNISVIPQDPVLFSGTIRSNIDPMDIHTDEEIWSALAKVKFHVSSLYSDVTDRGSNFSAGQKQLLCLARSIIAKNMIIILDEATANMDDDTDHLIRSAIEENFKGCTIITIAHNLESIINCDRVMVVDKGEIVEFDGPCILFGNKTSQFRQMIETAGLQKKLEESV